MAQEKAISLKQLLSEAGLLKFEEKLLGFGRDGACIDELTMDDCICLGTLMVVNRVTKFKKDGKEYYRVTEDKLCQSESSAATGAKPI